jgi:hypothetical protein
MVGAIVLATIGAIVWLSTHGVDPGPTIKFVLAIGGAVGGTTGPLTLILQLASRSTTAKVERNTGVLASAVYDVADAMPRPVARHAAPDSLLAMQGAAPAPEGR